MKCVYVASPTSQQIHVFELAASGHLTLLQVVETPGEVQPLTVSFDRQYLYAAVRPHFAVVTYGIEADGRLSEIAKSAIPKSASSSCLDATGQFLLLTSYAQNGLMVCPVIDGVAQEPQQVIEHLTKAHCVITVEDSSINPQSDALENQVIFVTCLGDDRINLYRFDDNQQLKPHTQPYLETAVGAGPRHLMASADGQHIYVVNELDGDVLHWIKPPGLSDWRLSQTLSYLQLQADQVHWAADIHLTADQRHLYVSERTQNTITCFAVDLQTGDLSYQDQIQTEAIPRGFDLDPDDQFLLCAGQGSDQLSVYNIAPQSRQLTHVERQPVGHEAMWVRVVQK